MKINFGCLPFKSKLLIDDRAKTSGFNRCIPCLKDNFSKLTKLENDTLILTTTKTQDDDNFELISEYGDTLARYSTGLSKYIDSASVEQLSTRLKNIHDLMQMQSTFNTIIKSLKQYREKCILELENIVGNYLLSEEEKTKQADRVERIISYLNKDIAYHSHNCKIETDSFELSHGMKDDLI